MVRGRITNLLVEVSTEERHTLEAWQRSKMVHDRLARRGAIILMLAKNDSISHISRSVGIQRRFVYKWAERFSHYGLEGLNDRYDWRNANQRSSLLREPPTAPGDKLIN